MVLMGVGEHNPGQIAPALNNKPRIRHLDMRRTTVSLKGNTAIHHQPLAIVAEEVEIHADFPAAAKGQKQEFTRAWRHGPESLWHVGHQ